MYRPLPLPAGLLPDFLVPSIRIRHVASVAAPTKRATQTRNTKGEHTWPTGLLNSFPLALVQEPTELRHATQPPKKVHTSLPPSSPNLNRGRPPDFAVYTGEGPVHTTVSDLRRELIKKNILTIIETANKVLARDPAELPTQDRENLSEFLSDFLRDAPLDTTRSCAESVAVKLCNRRSWAINSALRYHLNHGNSTRVLELYNSIVDAAPLVFVSSPKVPGLHAKMHWVAGKLPMMITPGTEEAVLYAIAAHAINKEYLGALETAMTVTPAVFLPRRVEAWMQHAFDQEQRAAGSDGLFRQYIIRIWLSRIFHNGLERQMRALAVIRPYDTGMKDLSELYALMKQGLQEGWLVLEHGGKYVDSAGTLDEGTREALEPESLEFQEEIPPEIPTVQPKHWIYFLKWYFGLGPEAREQPLLVWDDALKMGVRPTPWMWSTLVGGYGDRGQIDVVYTIFERMQAAKTRPDISSMTALMGALFKMQTEDSIQSAMDIFQQIRRQVGRPETWGHTAFVPNALLVVRAYNRVLEGLLRNKSTSSALEIFEGMRRKGPLPDVATYNILIQQYGRMKETRKQVASMLRALHGEKGRLKPDAYTFAIILTALRRHGMEGAVGLVISSMKEFGVQPNTRVMGSLIETIFKQRETDVWQEALAILDEMEREKRWEMKPNSIIYTQFITQLSRLRREALIEEPQARQKANDIIERMLKQDFRPNNITYHSLMVLYLTFRGREAAEDALQWLVKIQEDAGGAKSNDWLALIQGLVERGDVDVAARAVKYMRQVGFQPDGWLAVQISRILTTNI